MKPDVELNNVRIFVSFDSAEIYVINLTYIMKIMLLSFEIISVSPIFVISFTENFRKLNNFLKCLKEAIGRNKIELYSKSDSHRSKTGENIE